MLPTHYVQRGRILLFAMHLPFGMNMNNTILLRLLFCLLALLILPTWALALDSDDLPIFDAHIHYSQDVWNAIPPQEAVHRLREAGIVRAMVSSSGDEGTQMLYEADPQLVIPVLRPYRKRGTLKTWMHDETVVPYIKERLARYRYVAIGEFHLEGFDADLPVVRELVQLAKQHGLMLHVHSDATAIEQIFKQDPAARILWAHAGFEFAYRVRELMQRHPNLWADLSFRREIFNNKRFLPDWRRLLVEHADRFMLGVDTYTPQRWLKVQAVMNWQRALLKALPDDVARRIAYENGERVIASRFKQ